MKFLDLFFRLPKPQNVIIDDDMIRKYQTTCNHGKDSDEEAI